MSLGSKIGGVTLQLAVSAVLAGPVATLAQTAPAAGSSDVTYTKDIAPIVQRSCENCHRVDGVAPMPLSNYDQVRPWPAREAAHGSDRGEASCRPGRQHRHPGQSDVAER